MDPGNQNQNQNEELTQAQFATQGQFEPPGATAEFATPVATQAQIEPQVPIATANIVKTFEKQDDLQRAIPVGYNPLAIPDTPKGDPQFVNNEKRFPSAPPETPQNNVGKQLKQNAYKNPTAIDPSKLKDLVGKSYAQTLLYLNLTKQIIKSQLENNTTDTTLIDLQSKIDKSIKELELSTEAKQKLQVNPISEDSSVSIAELLVEIAGLGMAVTAAAGGKRRSKKSKKRRGKSKKRRTRRH